jgi:hypothetical protein
MTWLLVPLIFTLFLINIEKIFDLLAHISRYRRYMRMYPACKENDRGRVWRHTK